MNYMHQLSDQELRSLVPSAFATEPYEGMSDRYAFIPTSNVIAGMRDAGFLPVQAVQSRTRIPGKQAFTKHMIRFRSSLAAARVGDSVLESILINGHDGSTVYDLFGGVFTFTCSNGACVSEGMLAAIKIRHTGDVAERVVESASQLFAQAPRVMEAVRDWSSIQLSVPEQHLLAESAHALRFPVDEETGNASTRVTPDMLLDPRRYADNKPDLWNTFNRVQENTIKGLKTRVRGHKVSAREIKGIDQNVRLNQQLWTLAEKMAELKRAA